MRRIVFALTALGTLAITAMPGAAQHWHADRHNRCLQHHSIASGYPYYYGPPAYINDDANYAAGPAWRRDAERKARRFLPSC